MGLKRREFLQQAGWLLSALGIGEAGWQRLADRYQNVLAQPTARKLALLVGVDRYPESPLHGCITDVELQRQLLIYRFGFQPSDILTLTDSQATRENIETAFVTHLSQQAKPGDAVVFHFSGCGSRVSLGDTPEVLQNSLVPTDDVLPSKADRRVNDILEETLLLLLRSLDTENAIAILDNSYIYPGIDKNGNFRIRSRPRPTIGHPSLAELTFREQLQSRKNYNPRGAIVLTASAPTQLAAEATWNGFTAGLFTYALTQTLWWTSSATSLQISFSRASSTVEQKFGLAQQPQIRRESKLSNDNLKELPAVNFADSMLNSPADGAVTAVEDGGKTVVQLWLGGLPPEVLDCCGTSVFTAVSSEAELLVLRGRTGLSAKAQILDAATRKEGQLMPGLLVRETIRVLPRNISLTVALDSGLERIERVDATSAFATIPQVSAVTGEQSADCRFGRVPETTVAQIASTQEPAAIYQSRYGLFSLGQSLIPHSDGDGGEAVKVAVQRLTPQLKTLLAVKLLRLTANESSSLRAVRAVLATLAPQARVAAVREPVRTDRTYPFIPVSAETEKSGSLKMLSLSEGSRIQYRLYNDGDRPVYFVVFCLDTAGRLLVLNPDNKNAVGTLPIAIAPGDNLSVPGAGAYGWTVSGPIGLVETQIIFSETPFDRTLAALEGGMQQLRDAMPIRVLLNPLKVVRAVLEDLHAASIPGVMNAGISTDDLALDVNVWATLSFFYRVIGNG
jgi:Caspase domain/Domain of unknown function (DUF4384)